MMHLFSLLPAVACVGMMVGAGAGLRLLGRTPLGRVRWLAARTHIAQPERSEDPRR